MDLNQVTVQSTNIEESIFFYKTLGLNLIVKNNHYARFECPEGNSTFSIHLTEKSKHSNTVVYFEVVDLIQRVIELESAGLVFSSQPTEESWLWHEARIYDPSGNEVCIYSAGKNRKNPPWRLP